MLCLCCEVVCCPGLAMSSTRVAVMSDYSLGSDPFDRKIIRCVNCMQVVACLCRCAAAFEPSCRDAADAMSCMADFAFWSVLGCMAGQVKDELTLRDHKNNGRNFSRPHQRSWKNGGGSRGGGGGGGGRAPPQMQMNRGHQGGNVGTRNHHPQQNYQPQQGVQGVVVSQAQPASQMMQVQCPQGAGPGTMIQIADSYGRLMQVQVPQGVYPGQTFMIQT